MKSKRHAKILELLQTHNIDTQDELLNWLRKDGFNVTQATVSRDIKDLQLVKTLSKEGGYRYTVTHAPETDMTAKFRRLFQDAVFSVDYALNTVVVKSRSGMAQAVCASLDSLCWESVVGTLAGEDTIFILTRDTKSAEELVAELKNYLEHF